MSGANTASYRVVQGHFYALVLTFEQDISAVAAKLFEKHLISRTTLEEARNSNQPSFDRSSSLLTTVLKKIELNQKSYDGFFSVLCGMGLFAGITKDLEDSLKLEKYSFNSSGSLLRPCQKQQAELLTRRHSDSEIIKTLRSDRDSGVSANSSFVAGDELLPEQEASDGSAFDDTLVLSAVANLAHMNVQVPPSPKRATSGLVYNSIFQNGNEDHILPELPIERTSSDGASPPTPSFPNSNTWNREAENTYLKSEICGLKQTVESLNTEKVSSAAKLEQQGIVVSQKDDVIALLKKECKEKDTHVEGLKKDKADMERKIKVLEDRCEEADLKQTKSKEEIKSLHVSHRFKLDKLQKELEEVESREKNAQIELANAKAKLSDAKLEKEREISKLREEFFKQEKIKHGVELEKCSLEKETMLRLALKDKELVLKDKELLMKDRELAQEKEKSAQEKANRAEQEKKCALEEVSSAREEARQEKAKRRDSELHMQKLEMEMAKLRMAHNTSSQ